MSDGEEIEIEKVSLSNEGEKQDKERTGKSSKSRSGGIRGILGRLLQELVRIVVDEMIGAELDRLSRRYRRASRRFRRLHMLAFVFLCVGIIAQTVALFVGVAWISQNFPATADPLFFLAGGVVGYLIAVVAGLVYSG